MSSAPKEYIAVVDPAVHRPEVECLNQLAQWSELPLSYHLPKMVGTHTLRRLASKPKAILVLGSASSVNDGDSWQNEMNGWLEPLMKSGVPTLGLCYGHQLICNLFGASVGYLLPTQDKVRGLREVQLSKNPLWGEPTRGKLVVTHAEVVESCPEGFDVVGASTEVPIDAVAHRTLPIWGFQAHPEATPYFLYRQDGDPVLMPDELKLGHQILKAFLKMAAQR